MAPQATALPIELRTQLQKSDLNRHIFPYEGSVLPSPRHSAIGVQRFELWTSRSQTERSNQTEPHPEIQDKLFIGRVVIFQPHAYATMIIPRISDYPLAGSTTSSQA